MEFEFDLDNPRENLEGVPEAYQSWYEQGDDGYVVAEQFKPAATNVNGLTRNLKETMSKRTAAGKEAGAAREANKQFVSLLEELELEDKSAAGLKKHVQALATRAAAGGKKGEEAQAQIEAIKEEMSRTHATEIGEKDQAIAERDKTIEGLVSGREISEAMRLHGAKGKFLNAYIEQRVRTVRQDDGTYRAVVYKEDGSTPEFNGAGDPLSVNEFVARLKADPDFAPAFSAEGKKGTGTPPGVKSGGRGTTDDFRSPLDKIRAGLSSK